MFKAIFAQIPNSITCLNLISGCIAIVMAFKGCYGWASIAIAAAAVFDFLDGAMARLMKAYSAVGKELDSLSDLVSFGVAPAAMVYNILPEEYSWTPSQSRYAALCVWHGSTSTHGRPHHSSDCQSLQMPYSG